MGLSGRKTKQRIGADPRNLSWADDAAKFGQSYLEKFGWSSSEGLGVDRDGMKSHIKVHQKLDMMGIGAMHSKDKDGIAWKQSKDFESLLARLNSDEASSEDGLKVEGFVRQEQARGEDAALVSSESDLPPVEKAGKKRKRNKDASEEAGEGEVSRNEKKKRKKANVESAGREENSVEEEKADRKRQKEENRALKAAKEAEQQRVAGKLGPPPSAVVPEVSRPTAPRPIAHRAHRARFLASKRLANLSETAMSEILGIAPTPRSVTTSTLPSTPGALTPLDNPEVHLEKLTTSAKSMADYFKVKLGAKSGSGFSSSTPSDMDGEDDRPVRAGFGFGSQAMTGKSEGPNSSSVSGFGAMRYRFAEMFAPAASSNLSSTTPFATPRLEPTIETRDARPLSTPPGTETPKEEEKGSAGLDDEGLEREERRRRKKAKKEVKAAAVAQLEQQDKVERSNKDEKCKKKNRTKGHTE